MNRLLHQYFSGSPPYRSFTFFLLLALVCAPAFSNSSGIELKVINNVNASKSLLGEYYKSRNNYRFALLNLALSKISEDITLKPVTVPNMESGRFVDYVKQGNLDLMWMSTSQTLEDDLIPIRIPIYKGLMGWRVFLIEEQQQEKFDQLVSLEELSELHAGQGRLWPDSNIMLSNGLKVVPVDQYNSLFEMLGEGRFDYFPRSIVEISPELQYFSHLHLAMEKHIALHYPIAFYFFVNKKNRHAAELLTRGFYKAIEDGSFDQVFRHYNQSYIQDVDIENRIVFHLRNPQLPKQTPLYRKELWYGIE